MTTTRTITITKEIEEKMRNQIEASAYPCECWPDGGHFIEAIELLKALGIEPSEDFADICDNEAIEESLPVHTCKPSKQMQLARIVSGLRSAWDDGFEAIEENPPVHTCKLSYKMQQARIISGLRSAWND